jgi:hypothetical protein
MMMTHRHFSSLIQQANLRWKFLKETETVEFSWTDERSQRWHGCLLYAPPISRYIKRKYESNEYLNFRLFACEDFHSEGDEPGLPFNIEDFARQILSMKTVRLDCTHRECKRVYMEPAILMKLVMKYYIGDELTKLPPVL